MRRQALRLVTAVAALLGGLALVLVTPAEAQTGYPPGVCTPTTSTQDAGAHNIGSVFTVRMAPVCLFDAGALIGVSVNGQDIGTKEANADGTVNVTVRVVSATQLEIDDPVTVASQCGVNNIVVRGPSSAARAQVTHTATFTVLCPGGAAKAVKGRVAFTGANVLRWGGAAAVLVALGGVLMVAARRRSRATGA